MNPGHEDCPQEIVQYGLLSTDAHISTLCLHEHLEPIQADDTIGMGPVVADYCQCCGAILKREDYL